MSEELFLEIIYQLNLIYKLLDKETNPVKRAKYEGMKEILEYILDF